MTSLFDFGMELEEPDLWDLIPEMRLRHYDRTESISEETRRYFATWDFGSPKIYWPHKFTFTNTHDTSICDNITVFIYPAVLQ